MPRAWLVLLLLVSSAAPGAEPSRLDDARRALASAQARAAAAAAQARALDMQATAERAAAGRAHRAGAAIRMELQAAEARVAAAQARLVAIDRARALAADRLAAERAPLAGLLATLERMALRPPAFALAEPRSVDEVAHSRAALAALTPAIAARTAAVRAELAEQQRLHAAAVQAKTQLADARKLLATRQAAFDQDEQKALVRADQAASDAGDVRHTLAALGEELATRRALVTALGRDARLNDRLRALPAPPLRTSVAGGTTVYRMPASGQVVVGMGEAAPAGSRARGLTIETAAGAPVLAPAAGRIAYVGPFRGYGQIIIIDHGHGWVSLLAGLAQARIRTDTQVRQGTPLGRMARARPLLTIELRHHTRPVDVAAVAASRSS